MIQVLKSRPLTVAEIAKHYGVRREVAKELHGAFAKGETATPLRPFIDFDERIGAMKCCRHVGRTKPRRCPRPSTHVRYLVGFQGRVAYCAVHAKQEAAVLPVRKEGP